MSIPVEIVGGGPDWPAWVQAVGSVLAIVAAVGVILLQKWLTDRDRARSQGEYVSLAVGLARQAAQLVRDIERTLDTGQIAIDAKNADDVAESLDRLPYDRMPTAEFALAYVNVRRAVRFYGLQYEQLRDLSDSQVAIALAAGIRTKLFNQAQAVILQVDRLEHEANALVTIREADDDADIHARIRAHRRGMGHE